jgi:hypothetical protein
MKMMTMRRVTDKPRLTFGGEFSGTIKFLNVLSFYQKLIDQRQETPEELDERLRGWAKKYNKLDKLVFNDHESFYNYEHWYLISGRTSGKLISSSWSDWSDVLYGTNCQIEMDMIRLNIQQLLKRLNRKGKKGLRNQSAQQKQQWRQQEKRMRKQPRPGR